MIFIGIKPSLLYFINCKRKKGKRQLHLNKFHIVMTQILARMQIPKIALVIFLATHAHWNSITV